MWTLLGLVDGRVLLVAIIAGTIGGGLSLFKCQCQDKRYEEEDQ